MFRNNSIIAMDIGVKNIKIISGKASNKGVSILSHGMCSTPGNSFFNGTISDKRDIIKAISDLMASSKIKGNSVILGIKGQDVITRHIEMPIMSDKQLKQAVRLEIQQYLPMDPNEYVIDCKKIGRIDSKEKRTYNVLLAAAPKSKINDYFYIMDKLGLRVKAVDLQANSMVRLFQHNGSSKPGIGNQSCIACVDIGYESSVVVLIEDGKLYFERELLFGVKNIDSLVKNVFALSSEDVDSTRNRIISVNSYENGGGSDDPRIYNVNNNVRQTVDEFIENIMKVFDFYTSSGFGKNISSVYISGGGSMINGLADYIGNSLNVDAKTFNMSMFPDILNVSRQLYDNIGLYINCISLVLRKD